MNTQKGFNRIFFILGLVASLFGCLWGVNYANYTWKAETMNEWKVEKIFHSFNWNKENIHKYHNAAKNIAEKDAKRRQKRDINNTHGPIDLYASGILPPHVKIEDLPNYKKSPPQYNCLVFKTTFPKKLKTPEKELKTPAYKIGVSGVLGAFLAFFLCYGGWHLIFFMTKWIIDGFKDK